MAVSAYKKPKNYKEFNPLDSLRDRSKELDVQDPELTDRGDDRKEGIELNHQRYELNKSPATNMNMNINTTSNNLPQRNSMAPMDTKLERQQKIAQERVRTRYTTQRSTTRKAVQAEYWNKQINQTEASNGKPLNNTSNQRTGNIYINTWTRSTSIIWGKIHNDKTTGRNHDIRDPLQIEKDLVLNTRMRLIPATPKRERRKLKPVGRQQGETRPQKEDRMTFLQLNLKKSIAATNELNKWDFDVALVTEPNIMGNKINLLKAPKESICGGKGARAGIVLNDINFWPVEPFMTKDLAVAALELSDNKLIYIASGYLDITREVILKEMDDLIQHCNRNKIPLLLGIDSNAHSVTWGESNTNKRGETLEEWLIINELQVENVGAVPTFIHDNGLSKSIIDLTITNRWAMNKVSEWEVAVNENSFSDHRKINFQLGNTSMQKQITSRPITKANWDNFTSYLEKMDATECLTALDVDHIANVLQEHLQEALDRVAPKKPRKISPQGEWWSKELELKRRILRHTYTKRKNHINIMEKYKELRKEYAKAIRHAKQQSWQDFCTKAESAKDVSKLVQILDNPPRRQMSLLHDNMELLSPKESVDHLLMTHFPQGKLTRDLPDTIPTGESDFTGICQYITGPKVNAAFKSFGDFKAAGPDEIPPIALKKLDHNHTEVLILLYKLSLATGKIPGGWRQMRVVFIPKAGKADYTVAKAYRPITLSNFILKGLERIIQWYILEHVITRPLNNQHAYTKGRSCETALSTFINDVEKSIYSGEYLLAVSLDCSGAFDSIKFEAAQEGMRKKNFPENINKWYTNLLKGRLVATEIQGITAQVHPARGSPQGGVLSPLIWNIVMDKFLNKYGDGQIKAIGYADDILLYVMGPDPTTLGELLQPGLDEVIVWGEENGLTFNPIKTTSVLFTRNRTKRANPQIFLKGNKLELTNSFKYLGIEIQRSLSWIKHVTQRTNKCTFLLNKCRAIIATKWGLTPARIEWIHKAIIRPKITYGALVWANGMTTTMENKLTRIQRLSLLLIMRPLRSTPTAGMEAIAGWLPLDLHTKEMGLNAFCRLQAEIKETWDGIGNYKQARGHIRVWRDMLAEIWHKNYPRETRISQYIWKDSILSSHTEKKCLPLNIYTDASKTEDNVGLAWAATIGNYIIAEDFVPAKEIDVYTGELMAIQQALEWLKLNQETEQKTKTTLFTD